MDLSSGWLERYERGGPKARRTVSSVAEPRCLLMKSTCRRCLCPPLWDHEREAVDLVDIEGTIRIRRARDHLILAGRTMMDAIYSNYEGWAANIVRRNAIRRVGTESDSRCWIDTAARDQTVHPVTRAAHAGEVVRLGCNQTGAQRPARVSSRRSGRAWRSLRSLGTLRPGGASAGANHQKYRR